MIPVIVLGADYDDTHWMEGARRGLELKLGYEATDGRRAGGPGSNDRALGMHLDRPALSARSAAGEACPAALRKQWVEREVLKRSLSYDEQLKHFLLIRTGRSKAIEKLYYSLRTS